MQTAEIEHQKNQTILNNVSDAIITVDPNKIITFLNKAAQELIGCGENEALNHPINQLIRLISESGEVSDTTYCPTGEIDVAGVVFQNEKLKLIGKGVERNVRITTSRLKNGSAINLGGIILLKDVTREQNLEQMKLDFVSMAAHELRTPLTSIRGYLELLQKDETAEKLSEREVNALQVAARSSEELLNLIENLLIVSEIEKGNLKINTTKTQVSELVTQVIGEFINDAAQKGLLVHFTPPMPQPPTIPIDIPKVKEVLRALLSNAVSYTQKGSLSVIIADKGTYVQIDVHDTGKGIPEDQISHLFTKFFRAKEKALVMENVGKGISLYICKKIISAHGGEIFAQSKVGEGTVMSFTLPKF